MKLDHLGSEPVARPAQPKWQQSQTLLLKLGLLRSQRTVRRQNLKSKGLLVKLGLLGPEQREHPVPLLQQAAVPAGEALPPGIAEQSTTTESERAETSGEAGPSWSRGIGAVKSFGEALEKLRVSQQDKP